MVSIRHLAIICLLLFFEASLANQDLPKNIAPQSEDTEINQNKDSDKIQSHKNNGNRESGDDSKSKAPPIDKDGSDNKTSNQERGTNKNKNRNPANKSVPKSTGNFPTLKELNPDQRMTLATEGIEDWTMWAAVAAGCAALFSFFGTLLLIANLLQAKAASRAWCEIGLNGFGEFETSHSGSSPKIKIRLTVSNYGQTQAGKSIVYYGFRDTLPVSLSDYKQVAGDPLSLGAIYPVRSNPKEFYISCNNPHGWNVVYLIILVEYSVQFSFSRKFDARAFQARKAENTSGGFIVEFGEEVASSDSA